MKKTILFFLAIWCIACTNENGTNKQNQQAPPNLDSLEQIGFNTFKSNPRAAIPIFKEVAEKSLEFGKLKKVGTTYLNLSNIYDENVKNRDSALIFADMSLDIWRQTKDSMQEANLLKYRGFLKGAAGKTKDGIKDVEAAIALYEQLGFEQGWAVSIFNLAQIYFEEGDKEKSAELLDKANQFWRDRGESIRVYTNNLFGIELYKAIGNDEKRKAAIAECEQIEKTIQVNNYLKKRFQTVTEE